MNDITSPKRGQLHSTPRVRPVVRPIVAVRHSSSTARPTLGIVEAPVVAVPVSKVVEPRVYKRLAKSAVRADVLSRPVPIAKTKKTKRRKTKKDKSSQKRKFTFRQILFTSLAIIVLGVTGYVSYDTWATNNTVKTEITSVSASTETPVTRQASEGKDTTPPPVNALKNYVVAPDLPRAIYISKIHVAARVLPMGVNPDNSIQAPLNIYDAGWYNGSVKPGEVGAVFIDGHSSADHQALFGNLGKLAVGDQVQLEKGDGTRLTYKVVHTETVDKDKVDMKSMLLPYGNALRGLNLITCAGDWINSQDTLTKRVLVYTEQI